eukprot:199165-Ditylum_brightwellii.AAC.1
MLKDFRGTIDEEMVSAIMGDYKSSKEDYNMFPYPVTWDDVYDMDNKITAPMHTLGPDMKLGWCKVFSVDTDNFGGW